MYILGINGSPRIGGNTDILLDKALEGCESKDARTEKIILDRMDMSPCKECENIRDDGICKLEDDFRGLYEKIKKANALILASPIFFGSLSAQTKIMIDRFQCQWRYKYLSARKPDPLPRKRPAGLILVEASRREDFFSNASAIVKNFFATADLSYKEELFCPGLEGKGEASKHTDFLAGAFELGRRIA